jgi:AcrR family transcriptional regulator
MATYASSKQTQDLLINAAGELVAELGFSNVSTRAVADKVGQNIGSIHYHFKSKENLFQAVIRHATRPVRENPMAAVISAHSDTLDTPRGQAAMVRRIIQNKLQELFDPDRPWWHHKIIYQVIRADENLLKILRDEVMQPELDALNRFFQHIDPSLDHEEAFMQTLLTMAPIIYHVESSETILTLMGKPAYPDLYIQKLENKIVLATQLLLGLPPDKPEKPSHEQKN